MSTTQPQQVLLDELQETILREIPICVPMGISVHGFDGQRLALQMPLAPNHNHRNTAFAGSLNALCTVTGWASVFLLARRHGLSESVVIRRSSIKYHRPVEQSNIIARCEIRDSADKAYFLEMLAEKGQAKIDLIVHVVVDEEPAVTFQGSYVIVGRQ